MTCVGVTLLVGVEVARVLLGAAQPLIANNATLIATPGKILLISDISP